VPWSCIHPTSDRVGGLEVRDVSRCLGECIREFQCVLAVEQAIADTVVVDARMPGDVMLPGLSIGRVYQIRDGRR
jgi:hypothetical protein